MSEFRGYTCDGDECDNVIDKGQRTRRTIKYEGPYVEGQQVEDLCRDCLPQDLDLKPLPRRTKNSGEATEAPQEASV